MIVSIHQPQYLPWLGYFDKIDQADIFCFLDNVQYKKNEWQNRNRIKTTAGWQWMTVPVQFRFGEKINEVLINPNVNWQRKHLQAIITNYRKAPYFDQYIHFFENAYQKNRLSISEVNIFLIKEICRFLEMGNFKTVLSSQMDLREDPTDRLIDICKQLGADTYLAGQAGAGYMDLKRFKKNGIKVIFQDFIHPVYLQQFKGFVSHLSIVDLLMNCGPESMDIIRRAQATK